MEETTTGVFWACRLLLARWAECVFGASCRSLLPFFPCRTRAKRPPAGPTQTTYHPRPCSGHLGGDSQVGDGVDSRAQLGPSPDSEFGPRRLGLRKKQKRPARVVLRRSILPGARQRVTRPARWAKWDSTTLQPKCIFSKHNQAASSPKHQSGQSLRGALAGATTWL